MLPATLSFLLFSAATIAVQRWGVQPSSQVRVLWAAGVVFLLVADPSGRSLWACAVVTLIAWAGALLMERAPPPGTWYAVCLIAILATWIGAELRGVAPLGMGIYGLHAIGYLTDVRFGRLRAEKTFSRIALFHAFFPLFAAGPIERAPTFLSSVRNLGRVRPDFVRAVLWPAVALMAAGFFKKLVIGDGLASFVDPIYREPEAYGATALFAAFVLGFHRIYGELSGYVDIALGVALLLGFTLPVQFHRPLLAVSLTDFWGRWQITFANWMRDYVQVPLAGRGRRGAPFWVLTFLLLGLWFGLEVRYAVFGLVHGLVVAAEHYWGGADRRGRDRGARVWGVGILIFIVWPSLLLLLCPNLGTFAHIFQGIAVFKPGLGMGEGRPLAPLAGGLLAIVALEVLGAWHARKPLLVRFFAAYPALTRRLRI